jgi:hypothetical protein
MQIGYLRRLPAYRKPALVGEINRMVEGRAMAGLRQRHPDGTQQQRAVAWLSRFLDQSWSPVPKAPALEKPQEFDGAQQHNVPL